MKKLMIIFLIIICSCGIGYLGYVIFQSKNIDSVKLVGNMQTVYIVGDEIDYEDAKLQVTYKNGKMKMISLDSSSVDIDYFSTSVETHGEMNIVYKSEVIKVPYNVIRKGAYYLKTIETKTVTSEISSNTVSNRYDINDSNEMIYIYGKGICNYYTRHSGGWYMIDGKYDQSNYNYSIVGDTVFIKLKNNSYSIKVDYLDNGKMLLTSKKLTKIENTELVSKQEIKTFEYTEEMKTNQSVLDASVAYNLIGSNFVEFEVGETIDSYDSNIYLKVTYAQYNTTHQFRTVYVKIVDNMVARNLNTTKKLSTQTQASLTYETKSNIALFYKVV